MVPSSAACVIFEDLKYDWMHAIALLIRRFTEVEDLRSNIRKIFKLVTCNDENALLPFMISCFEVFFL